MSRFWNTFLLEASGRPKGQENKRLHLAAFGKHPGWDDHIDDIGLDTESLVQAKQLLYLQGIGEHIDQGTWTKLPPEHKLPQLLHLFIWMRSGHFLLGRLWSSRDGKGRALYPMVGCFEGHNLPLARALGCLLPELEHIQKECLATQSADEVRNIMQRSLTAGMNPLFSHTEGSCSSSGISALDYARIFGRPAWAPQGEAFPRVVHQFREQLGLYQSACRQGGGKTAVLKPQQIRVPRAADTLIEAILLWEQFVYVQTGADTPVLMMIPLEGSWIDITLGEPTTGEFFCLLANEQALPLASSIPYRLAPEIHTQALRIHEMMRERDQPWLPQPKSAHAPLRQTLTDWLTHPARKVRQIVNGREE